MSVIKIYTKQICPYCEAAKSFFQRKGLDYEEIRVDVEGFDYEALKKQTGWKTVPQIFIGETFIGGYDDLMALETEGKLTPLLKKEGLL